MELQYAKTEGYLVDPILYRIAQYLIHLFLPSRPMNLTSFFFLSALLLSPAAAQTSRVAAFHFFRVAGLSCSLSAWFDSYHFSEAQNLIS